MPGDRLHVACAVAGCHLRGQRRRPLRTLHLDDLRDIVVKRRRAPLSTDSRSAGLLTTGIDSTGTVGRRVKPQTDQLLPQSPGQPDGTAIGGPASPWQLACLRQHRHALYERGIAGRRTKLPGGYGNGQCKAGIVASAITIMGSERRQARPDALVCPLCCRLRRLPDAN